MLEAAKPRNEDERLAVLHALDLLDKPKEQRFERITSIASTTFGVPIALVTLLDTDQQHFKACVGLDIPGTARSVSFCSHAILQPDIMLVEDATLVSCLRSSLHIRAPQIVRYKTRSAGNGYSLAKERNAVAGDLRGSLRASQNAAFRGVALA